MTRNKDLSIERTPSKQRLDFVMVTQERDEQLFCAILKYESQRDTAAAFKKPFAHLANADAAVHVRPTKYFWQFRER
jgi:hypothetical protein